MYFLPSVPDLLSGPLDTDAWRDCLVSWLRLCAAAQGVREEVDCLRKLAILMQSAPREVSTLLGYEHDSSDLELLLEAGAVETAAAKFVAGAPFGFLISQAYCGPAICTASPCGSDVEVHYSCNSLALVKLGAVMKTIGVSLTQEDLASLPCARPSN